MTQLALFTEPMRTPRWLCHYDGACPRQGRAEALDPIDSGTTIETPVRCLTCGVAGYLSGRKDLLAMEVSA